MDCKLKCKKVLLNKEFKIENGQKNVVNTTCDLLFDSNSQMLKDQEWWVRCKSCGQLFIDTESKSEEFWKLRLPTKKESIELTIYRL